MRRALMIASNQQGLRSGYKQEPQSLTCFAHTAYSQPVPHRYHAAKYEWQYATPGDHSAAHAITQAMGFGIIPVFLLGGGVAFLRQLHFFRAALRFREYRPDVKSRRIYKWVDQWTHELFELQHAFVSSMLSMLDAV